jgi:long-chain acyl-CoA synthetase
MTLAFWARTRPDALCVKDGFGKARTFATANANANRLARVLRAAGAEAGDGVAMVCSNRVEFYETYAANERAGGRLTPVNWHLVAEELAYIVEDCEAKALLADARLAEQVIAAAASVPELALRISVGGPIDGFIAYEDALAAGDPSDLEDPHLGGVMLYTSGTTGRPKGVFWATNRALDPLAYSARGYDDDARHLAVCPGYHGTGIATDLRGPLTEGATLVYLDRWDAEEVLRVIEAERITHLNMVPIMFQRLLALPQSVRDRYDLSRLRYLRHGAAPCSVEVKRAMIDWLGPILTEYYSATEGGQMIEVDSHEWLRKPGTVGRVPDRKQTVVLYEGGAPCPPGVAGGIYHRITPATSVYYKDPAKTAARRLGDWFTVGDIGYLDEDDYLFLTGRDADTIISGGVNIYPQKIDDVLLEHPAVADAGTVGVPDDEWGEQVRAVVALRRGVEPTEALADEILRFTRERLPSFKVPRRVDFLPELPRLDTGKLQRGVLRARYWEGRSRQI